MKKKLITVIILIENWLDYKITIMLVNGVDREFMPDQKETIKPWKSKEEMENRGLINKSVVMETRISLFYPGQKKYGWME